MDTIHYQTTVNGLLVSGGVDALRRKVADGKATCVMEIGAGFGALAFHLLSIIGGNRYVIVDLPESIACSAAYLAVARPDLTQKIMTREDAEQDRAMQGYDVIFVPNHLLPTMAGLDASMDVVINVMSLSEMSSGQVSGYAEIVARSLAPGGVFYEQNHVVQGNHVDIVPLLSEKLPYRRRLKEGLTGEGGSGLHLDPHSEMSLWSTLPNAEFALP